MPPSPSLVAEWFPALGLAELEAVAALQDRVDIKYVMPLSAPGIAGPAHGGIRARRCSRG